MTRWRTVPWTTTLAILAACGGDGPPEPPPITGGPVRLVLQASQPDVGAIIVRIVGPVDSVTVATGLVLSSTDLGSTASKIVVAGNIAAGNLATLWVPDLSVLNIYSVFVEQVSSRINFALYDPASFSVNLVK